MSTVDPRTPVIVGIGQVTNRRDRLVDALTLAEEAVRAADADAGGRTLPKIGSVQVVNIVSSRYKAPASLLASRLGLEQAERFTTTVGGSTPLWLLIEACNRVATGEIDGVLIAGAEAVDSARRARKQGVSLTDEIDLPPDKVVGDDRAPLSAADLSARVMAPSTIYPMFEQALAARDERSPDEQRTWLGELMAPFTKVAASNPDIAWFPRELTADEISAVTPDNRMIAEPYPKNLNSIIQVDMAAALILLSAEAAEAAGVPNDRWVFPWAGAMCDDVFVAAQRPDFTRSPGLREAARAVFDATGTEVDDVATFDFYSCFPSAVQIGAEALGVAVDDPRGLTVTGGLPYFGGPGNNYVTHSIACTVERLRAEPSSLGVVTGISWFLSKHGIGLFSATPLERGWFVPDTTAQERIESEALTIADAPEGEATVVAFTVEHDRDAGPVRAPVYATLDDGRRVVASPADAELPTALAGRNLVGESVRITSGEGGSVYDL